MNTVFDKVKEFAVKAESYIPDKPTPISDKQIHFIIRMVYDEMAELADTSLLTEKNEEEVIKKIAAQTDALVDTIYYLIDCSVKHNVNLKNTFSLVHSANMRKIKNGVRKRKDGKILKPENWQPPEPAIEDDIRRQLNVGIDIHEKKN